MFKNYGKIPGRIFIYDLVLSGTHTQRRILTKYNQYRGEQAQARMEEQEKNQSKGHNNVPECPLISSIELPLQFSQTGAAMRGHHHQYRIPFFHILLSTKKLVGFFLAHISLSIQWHQLSLDNVIMHIGLNLSFQDHDQVFAAQQMEALHVIPVL